MNRPIGRPPILDSAKKRDICTILSLGGTRRLAADRVCCSVDTIRRAAKKDFEFATALRKAESESEVVNLRTIRSAAKGNWRAAAWVLERIRPSEYAKRGPECITREQIVGVVNQFADEIVDEIDDPNVRKRVRLRLRRLSSRLDEQAQAAIDAGKPK